MVTKIVSGGQTGADRAGFDAALELEIPIGGYTPSDRWAEDGTVPERYTGLIDSGSNHPAVRTRLNVEHSDGTLIFTRGRPQGGSALTIKISRELKRPRLHINLFKVLPDSASDRIRLWLDSYEIKVLNVAGSRESKEPGIYEEVKGILLKALADSKDRRRRSQPER
jgi:Circularly permutated YpsA SLOG family